MRYPFLTSFACVLLLGACSTSDFFLGEDNRPAAKALPEVNVMVDTRVMWADKLGDGGEESALSLRPDGDGNLVYAVSADGVLKAYSIDTGNKKFTRKLNIDITAGVRYGAGLLLLVTRNGDLLALDSKDGSDVWMARVGGAVLARPAIGGDKVVVQTVDGQVHAYSIDNGTHLWQYHITDSTLSVRGQAEPVVAGGAVIVSTSDGRFLLLEENSGFPIAEQRVAVGEGSNDIQRLVDVDATPKINQSVLFGSAHQANTFAVNLDSGQVLWTQPDASTAQDFAMSPDGLFLHNDIDHVYALNQRDGSIRWQNSDLEGRYLSPMIALPGRVGTIDNEGFLYWFDINDGKLIGQKKIGESNALSEPYLSSRAIVWQLANGRIVAIKP